MAAARAVRRLMSLGGVLLLASCSLRAKDRRVPATEQDPWRASSDRFPCARGTAPPQSWRACVLRRIRHPWRYVPCSTTSGRGPRGRRNGSPQHSAVRRTGTSPHFVDYRVANKKYTLRVDWDLIMCGTRISGTPAGHPSPAPHQPIFRRCDHPRVPHVGRSQGWRPTAKPMHPRVNTVSRSVIAPAE